MTVHTPNPERQSTRYRLSGMAPLLALFPLASCFVQPETATHPAAGPAHTPTTDPEPATDPETQPATNDPDPSDPQTDDATIYVDADGTCSTTDHRGNYARGASSLKLTPDHEVCAQLKRATEAALTEAGFTVITNRDVPHRYVAKLSSKRAISTKKSGSIVTTSRDVTDSQSKLIVDDRGATVATVDAASDGINSEADAQQAAHTLVERLQATPVHP